MCNIKREQDDKSGGNVKHDTDWPAMYLGVWNITESLCQTSLNLAQLKFDTKYCLYFLTISMFFCMDGKFTMNIFFPMGFSCHVRWQRKEGTVNYWNHQSSIINHYVVTIIISFYTIILKNPYCKGCCALHGMFYYIKVMASVFTSFSQDCLLPEPDRKKHIDVCKEISFEYIKLT